MQRDSHSVTDPVPRNPASATRPPTPNHPLLATQTWACYGGSRDPGKSKERSLPTPRPPARAGEIPQRRWNSWDSWPPARDWSAKLHTGLPLHAHEAASDRDARHPAPRKRRSGDRPARPRTPSPRSTRRRRWPLPSPPPPHQMPSLILGSHRKHGASGLASSGSGSRTPPRSGFPRRDRPRNVRPGIYPFARPPTETPTPEMAERIPRLPSSSAPAKFSRHVTCRSLPAPLRHGR